MARGVNKVILIGNLGAKPEVRYMPSGDAMVSVSLATTDTWKDKNSGEAQERTEWHRLVFFKRLAEIAGQYLDKGSKAYIEGRLQTRKWQDKDGIERYTTEVVVNDMQMLDSRSGGSAPFDSSSESRNYSSAPPQQQQRPAARPAPSAAPEPDFDDDIPF